MTIQTELNQAIARVLNKNKSKPAPVVAVVATGAKPPNVQTEALEVVKKQTHSYQLFNLFKKQGGTATVDELAKVTGLKPFYISWYMAEMKRVYGVEFEHKRGDPVYRVPNLEGIEIPPEGLTGRRRSAIAQVTNKEQTTNAEILMDQALANAKAAALAAIDKEFARLRASLGKVKLKETPGEVRVASIPWDVWMQMKKEQQSRSNN